MTAAIDSSSYEESWTIFSDTPQETFRLGEALGKEAKGGEVIGLIGPLGVGKTLFVQGLAKGLDVTDSYISSPTFILVHPHEGRLLLYHIDLYRLESGVEIGAIGLEEYLEGNGVAAIEWADKGFDFLPQARLIVTLRYAEGNQRGITLTASSPLYKMWIKKVKQGREWKEVEGE